MPRRPKAAEASAAARRSAALRRIYRALFAAYGPQNWWPADTPFEMIVGAILTQNTSWTNVEKAMANLRRRRWLSPRRLEAVALADLADELRPSGYFNQKAARLKDFVRHLRKRHSGRLERMLGQSADQLRAELLGIRGIGPETADSIVLYAAGLPSFVVDAYTRRIFKRLALIRGDEGYEEIRRLFEASMGPDARLFNEYHALIVRHAKEHCRSVPACPGCPLSRVCSQRPS